MILTTYLIIFAIFLNFCQLYFIICYWHFAKLFLQIIVQRNLLQIGHYMHFACFEN